MNLSDSDIWEMWAAAVSEEHRGEWREVESRLRALGVRLSSKLSDDQRKWYAEFLDANELGLALEMLADWLSEEETPISAIDRTEMVAVARVMGNNARVAGPLRLCPPER